MTVENEGIYALYTREGGFFFFNLRKRRRLPTCTVLEDRDAMLLCYVNTAML